MRPSIQRNGARPSLSVLILALLCGLSLATTVLSLSSTPTTPYAPLSVNNLTKRYPQVVPNTANPPYTCITIGECQACSALQVKTEESCKDTHNRQRIECKYDDPKNDENEELKIRLPTYHSCLRVKAVEARRFAHFLSSNVFLALFSGILMMWRKRKLAAAQYRRMARRIGIA
ncbi:hypothetical protein BGZ90_001248 [Linnemannia elongata]|nr:hypothetical protein BGZ90_001248 [Linnemannia elongata]